MAPMAVDVTEAVLMPGPDPQGEAEMIRAGRMVARAMTLKQNKPFLEPN